jgi:hypothetical protein
VAPIFTVDVALENALPNDSFDFHLLDMVAVWSGGTGDAGAFCAAGPFPSLDSGGDSVPDGTSTIYGIDPDTPVPMPPAAFLVDYVDGPPGGGPAVILVTSIPVDINADGEVDVLDMVAVIVSWGAAGGPADANGDGVVDVLDLLEVILHWGPVTC